MRRRVTYALGGHFIAPHKSMLFLSYLGVPGGPFRSSLGALRARFDVLASLCDAQASQIRGGVFLNALAKINKLSLVRRLHTYAPSADPGHCGDRSLMHKLCRSASV